MAGDGPRQFANPENSMDCVAVNHSTGSPVQNFREPEKLSVRGVARGAVGPTGSKKRWRAQANIVRHQLTYSYRPLHSWAAFRCPVRRSNPQISRLENGTVRTPTVAWGSKQYNSL